MEIYKFKTMTGINREALYSAFQKLLYNEQMKHPSFDYDKYEWVIGGDVFARLRQTIDWHSYSDSDEIDKYLGIDLKVFSPGLMSTTIFLDKKNSEGITPYKRYLNSIYGTKMFEKDTPKKVIFNDPATIVYWKDGTKTVVKAEGEPFDPEKGLAMAIAKKHLGNEGNYYDIFKEWLPEEETKWKDPAEKVCSTCKYFSLGPSSMSTCLDCLKGENLPNLEKKDEADNQTHITRSFDILTAEEFAKLIGEPLINVTTACELGVYKDKGAKKIMGEWLIPYLKTSEV